MPDRVLIVDDDEEIREVLRVLLTGEGFDVAEASGGEEALACLEAWGGGVELVILDVRNSTGTFHCSRSWRHT